MKSERDMSDAVAWQLVAMVYNQRATLVVGGLAISTVAAICWHRSHEPWFLAWGAATLIVLACRLCLERAFHQRYAQTQHLRTWRGAFVAGAWVMGTLWGMAGATIAMHDEPLVQMFVISVQTVIIMGGAARNASVPLAARGQTALGLAPVFVACVASGDPYYRTFSLFIAFAFFASQTIIHHLFDQHVRFLCMNEENVELLREIRYANRELAAANRQLESAATTDSLTGIANRRRFDAVLAAEVRHALDTEHDLSLLFLDIDAFKGYNDLYGHQAGDESLQRVAEALALSFTRSTDLVARYGGEEFAVILPQTDLTAATIMAEQVRANIEALALRSAASPSGVISVSIGVAGFVPGSYVRPEDFIRGADEALYAAKGAGRNCVRAARAAAHAAPEWTAVAAGRRAGTAPEDVALP